MKQHIFIFGLGFTGLRLAKTLVGKNTSVPVSHAAKQVDFSDWSVSGTTRSEAKAERYALDYGINAISYDSTMGDDQKSVTRIIELLQTCTHVLITAAPTAYGDPILLNSHIRSTIQARISSTENPLPWIGYLSTIGVYGNRDGAEVDEKSELLPTSERGKRRKKAEATWASLGIINQAPEVSAAASHPTPLHIFRLPGIYGPGRGPLQKVRSGKARRLLKEGQIFSRMHVDDIVQCVILSMIQEKEPSEETHSFPRIYNCVDDEPCAGHIPVTFAAELLQVCPPPYIKYEDAKLSAMARSFYSECRYIRNVKVKTELGLQLLYPTFREGLMAQHREELQVESEKLKMMISEIKSKQAQASKSANDNEVKAQPASLTQEAYVILVDNGSVRAASTLNLRAVGEQLEKYLQEETRQYEVKVIPTSARWSDRVDSGDLKGIPAELLSHALTRIAENKLVSSTSIASCFGPCFLTAQTPVIIVPFFFGPSATVTNFIPQEVSKVRSKFPGLHVRIAPPLISLCPYLASIFESGSVYPGQAIRQESMNAFPTDVHKDNRIARIVHERIQSLAQEHELDISSNRATNNVRILLCDHGTPSPAVNDVRRLVTAQVSHLLGNVTVTGCCMERRPQPEYDFNAPLLSDELASIRSKIDLGDAKSTITVVVALLFLSPGKHAGPGGDIAQIIKQAQTTEASRHPDQFRVLVTEYIGSHPGIIHVLADRCRQTVQIL